MNAHRVMVLGVVAVVAIGAALWSTQTRKPAQEDLKAQPLVPGLEAGINSVAEVRIRTAGDALQATLRRNDDGWVLVEKDNYAVDVDKLSEYLVKLSRAKRVEAKTDNPALYERLGVEEVSAKDAQGAQIEIDGLGQQSVKLIVGINVASGQGSYARLVGEAQSWQADTDLAVEKVAANWLQRDLIDIAAGRVTRVDVAPPQGPAIKIERSTGGSGGDFAVANLPKGREQASEFVADGTAGLLSGLRFDDVLRASENAPPAAGVTHAVFVTQEGLGIDVTAWTVGDKTYAQLGATLDDALAAKFVEEAQAAVVREYEAAKAQAEAPPADPAKPDAAKPAAPEAPLAATRPDEDKNLRLAALHAEMTALNQRLADKTFVLPSFKAGNLNKPLEEYLKPKG